MNIIEKKDITLSNTHQSQNTIIKDNGGMNTNISSERDATK